MASPLRPSSPSHIPPNLQRSLDQAKSQLNTGKDELSQLSIPKFKDSLAKLVKLLDLSKKIRGKDATVQLIDHTQRLYQIALAPILEAKQADPSFSISDELRTNLAILFNALDAAITEKSQFSRTNPALSRVDTGSAVQNANPRIGSALDSFLQHGFIEKTNGCHLIQSQISMINELGYPPQPGGPSQMLPLGVNPGFPSQGPHIHEDASFVSHSATGTSTTGELPPQVQQTLIKCPRFRILLLGKSGAGKSSLINKVFGVPKAKVADYQAGHANINQEHTYESNPYFVFHDSTGFESGSNRQYAIVENFIKERGKRSELSEKVHAIWLCASIPINNDRVFEAGDEQIFKLDLEDIPIVVVFTKYDNLVAMVEMEDLYLDDNQTRIKAENYFDELCTKPLQEVCTVNPTRGTPPFLKVSAEEGYENTLMDLIKLTRGLLPPDARDQVPVDMGYQPRQIPSQRTSSPDQPTPADEEADTQDLLASTVGISFSIAQRVDPDIKVDDIIAVGRQRYWRGLASGLDFSGKTLERCIAVIHHDIVQVWNFPDPNEWLSKTNFKAMMTQIVDDLFERGSSTSSAKLSSNLSSAAAATSILAAMEPASAIVVGPLTLTVVAAKWVYDVYQQTPGVLRCLMAYIVDLTIVMQRLFWHLQVKGSACDVSEDVVVQSVNEYNDSAVKVEVHRAIENFVDKMSYFEWTKKDVIVGKVEDLIRKYRFEPLVS